MSIRRLRTCGILGFVVLIVAAGAGAYVHYHSDGKDADDKKDARLTQRSDKIVAFKSAEAAASFGIATAPAKPGNWHPRIFVDGRVIPNPNATLAVFVPSAGRVQLHADTPPLRFGARVKAQQPLVEFEVRFSSLEKLELQNKVAEAEERFKAAEKAVDLRKQQMKRLKAVQGSAVSPVVMENATLQLNDALAQKEIVLGQRNLWKQALQSIGKEKFTVTIKSPLAGEIAEIGAQPGSNLEAGKLLVRIVDFRRVLIRLDFPINADGGAPPADVEVETPTAGLETRKRWHATLRGEAPNVEPGLQKAGYLYEITARDQSPPNWRPGLYVKAVLPDPASTAQPAVAVPASAVLMHQGRTLVYVEKLDADQKPTGRYERCEVHVLGRDGHTVYLSSGLRGDEQVVSRQAQVILSEEFRSDEE